MISSSQSFKIFELLNKYFKNEQDAKVLVSENENIINARFQSEKDHLATKEDIVNLIIDFVNVKVEIIRWVFAFFITLALMIIGLYFKK